MEDYKHRRKEVLFLKDLEMSGENLKKFIRLQAFIRRYFARRTFQMRKKHRDLIINDKKRFKVLSRFYVISKDKKVFLGIVRCSDDRREIMIEGTCKTQKNVKTNMLQLFSHEECNEFKSESFTASFCNDLPQMLMIHYDSKVSQYLFKLKLFDCYKNIILTRAMRQELAKPKIKNVDH
jgi:hypothetical protein